MMSFVTGSRSPLGIWTKHLKTKTNLHQTIIDRSLKTLTQKRLVKRVPSVQVYATLYAIVLSIDPRRLIQHPTRKIYMLEGLEPSISLTGGPWYTDNELDTEFIQHLTEVCYKFVRDTVSRCVTLISLLHLISLS